MVTPVSLRIDHGGEAEKMHSVAEQSLVAFRCSPASVEASTMRELARASRAVGATALMVHQPPDPIRFAPRC
jgi:hypothetical protein